MDFAIVWTEPALTDLQSIIWYIQTRDPSAAESVRISILETVELLARFPFIGPQYAARSNMSGQGNPVRSLPHLLPSQ